MKSAEKDRGEIGQLTINLENSDEKPRIRLIDANQEIQRQLSRKMVHLIEERKIQKRKPAMA